MSYSDIVGLNLYHTNDKMNGLDHDCLYYSAPHKGLSSQLIEYCIRFDFNEELTNSTNYDHRSFTFEELRQNNITSFQLYTWLAPIDVAEDYEIYLDNNNATLNTMRYYNCTYPWFGIRCEYSFVEPLESFAKQIKGKFMNRIGVIDNLPLWDLPCYIHIQCDRIGTHDKIERTCLDWREICDGEINCMNGGVDEEECWQLEINECDNEREFRCHNGLCIPLIFLNDDNENADCLDRTDERVFTDYPNWIFNNDYEDVSCYMEPGFRCEDRTSYPTEKQEYFVECGDGSRIRPFEYYCFNGRNIFLVNIFFKQMNIPDICRLPLSCILWSQTPDIPNYMLAQGCSIKHYSLYAKQVKEHCPTLITLPPVLFGHVYLVYNHTQFLNFMEDDLPTLIPPTYICYNTNLCGFNRLSSTSYPRMDLLYNNSTCHYFNSSVLAGKQIYSWHTIINAVYRLFYSCSNYHQLSSTPTSFQSYACINSSKIISQHRLVDKIQDCPYGDDELYTDSCSLNDRQHRFKCEIKGKTVCLARVAVLNGYVACDDRSDEKNSVVLNLTTISFQTMCDGVTELPPILIDGRYETDETECNYFPCNTIYTRCDGLWNCIDGMDEINCEWPPLCPPLHHMCLSPVTRNLVCLSIEHVNDNITDCLGASDERGYCRQLHNLSIPSTIATTDNVNNNLSRWNRSMAWYCNRGIIIRHLIKNKNDSELKCLCPPAYYGKLCEYQNERISLTIQVNVSSDWRHLFTIVIILRDDKQNRIESYDEINYLPYRDCNTKFHLNLLYSTRPKNRSTNYSIHMDVYNKHTFNYHVSWIYPIVYSFLPVYPLSVELQIPSLKTTVEECEDIQCGLHGHCFRYVNRNISFCQCDTGWSGMYCDTKMNCSCSSDSYCIYPSICLCPLDRFGRRCHLKRSRCSCENGGTCILNDVRLSEKNSSWCICREGFIGLKCEKISTNITISFEPIVTIQSLVLVHFIQVLGTKLPPIHSAILKKYPFDKDTITVTRHDPFHIIFVEIHSKTFYLALLEVQYKHSMNVSLKVMNANRCLSTDELFNVSFNEMHVLRRMKSYHIPCQQQINLACFYDKEYMCICNKTLKQANCFPFKHSVDNYGCRKGNLCENNGRCFYDQIKCPSLSICVCDACSYGSQCQFSTEGFRLSLDTILGYQIRPNEPVSKQRTSIKITIAMITIMFILNVISNILSIMTFHTTKAREVGSGDYLLIASLISIVVIIIFLLKFIFLFGSQMGFITDRSYIKFNCIIIDYLLRSLLTIIDWLYVSVSIERAIAAMKDIKFDKTKAKRTAKWVVLIICLFTFVSFVHDPIHRELLDDQDDDIPRTWCNVNYSTFIKAYNSIIILFHFFLPFIFNIISAFIIIINVARHKSNIQKNLTYKEQLRKQFFTLKRLLISPFILIALALPQLIISFSSGCMKSPREPWLYLIGYLISFIPSMLIFFIFVLPSDVYTKELTATVQRIRQYFPSR